MLHTTLELQMGRTVDSGARFEFHNFELNIRSGELRRDGRAVKLQLQPFKVLALLVSRAGQVVTRGEICRHVWGGETFVDYEQGLNYCIRQIRTALGEAEGKIYVETLPRRGYRFVVPVQESRYEQPRSAGRLITEYEAHRSDRPRTQRRLYRRRRGTAGWQPDSHNSAVDSRQRRDSCVGK